MKISSFNQRFLKFVWLTVIFLFAISIAILWQQIQTPEVVKQMSRMTNMPRVEEPIQPIPFHIELDGRKVKLGEKLFDDVRLSGDKKVACVSCHNLNTGGVDRKGLSVGVNGQLSSVNSLTVFNSGLNFKLTWNGKYKNLFDHLDEPLLNPKTMDISWSEILNMLQNSPDYVREFLEIYPDGISQENVKDALVVFQESLITPNSPFDRFLLGDINVITEEEKQGYQIFKDYGCISCHQGINVGGNIFQKFGVLGDYFRDRGNLTQTDLGRFNVTGDEGDRYVFRVPSLRNVELTPPYFHDGSAETLEDAIDAMAKYQLGRPLSEEQINLIVQFLKTLTGEYQGQPL